jgi:hypothetical protein
VVRPPKQKVVLAVTAYVSVCELCRRAASVFALQLRLDHISIIYSKDSGRVGCVSRHTQSLAQAQCQFCCGSSTCEQLHSSTSSSSSSNSSRRHNMIAVVHACRDTTIALKPKFTLPAGAPSPKKLCPGASYSLKVRQHCTAAGVIIMCKYCSWVHHIAPG